MRLERSIWPVETSTLRVCGKLGLEEFRKYREDAKSNVLQFRTISILLHFTNQIICDIVSGIIRPHDYFHK